MDITQQILSDVTIFNKYAKFINEIDRRETWSEICERNMVMHIRKYPQLKDEIKDLYDNFVVPKKVLPSMRSMQFGGRPIELSNNRVFNCFGAETRFITSAGVKAFSDLFHGDNITVLTHLNNWKPAIVKNYGKQQLTEITFARGKNKKIVRATKNHRWILADGNETTNLSIGDTLFPITGTRKYGITNSICDYPNSGWTVSNIKELEIEEDVWCLEVEDDHSFVLSGGLTTGNCAYLPITHPDAFSEIMFLLLGGTGVGYSVQIQHVAQLPLVVGVKEKTRRFLVGDSIEGWADAIKIIVESYFYGKSDPVFDYRDIRPKGARLITSGGKAPGPDPLRLCIEHLRSALNNAKGRNLAPLEVHDILCHVADAVLSGGIRRAAMIALFSKGDLDMLTCKTGTWWELSPQRGRANNSVVLHRAETTEDEFDDIWERVQISNAGEPGIFWTNNYDLGTNPCCFVGDTLISTTVGQLSIKDIVEKTHANELVFVQTFNENTRQLEVKQVVNGIKTKENASVVTLDIEKIDGSIATITCTPDHKFLTKNRGWVEAINLTGDDDIVEQNIIPHYK